jgi:hypothetical protein
VMMVSRVFCMDFCYFNGKYSSLIYTLDAKV